MTDPTGQYQMKSTGLHYEQTTDGQIKTIKTYAGTATRFGQISGTLIITQPLAEAGGNGLCSWAGKALLEDGTIIGSVGEGTTTRSPRCTSWQQPSRPIPRLPPVTSTVRLMPPPSSATNS